MNLAMLTAITTITAGPSFAVHGWEASLIIAAAVVAALAGIWKVLVPFARACVAVGRAVETLTGIATEFQPNGGHSLHDTIVRIEAHTAEAVGQGKEAAARAQEAAAVGAITHEKLAVTHAKLAELWAYTHESHHGIVTALTRIGPSVELVQQLAARLADKPRPMDDP